MLRLAPLATLLLPVLATTVACDSSESGVLRETEVEETAPAAPRPLDDERAAVPDPFTYTDELLARRDAMQRTEGELVMGDASAAFVAFLDDGEPVLIEERVSLGDYGQQENRYALAGARLLLYESSGIRTIIDPARAPGEEKVEVVLTFDAEGGPHFTAMTVDGRSVEVDETLIAGALARAETLRRATLDAAQRSD
jgi:hypothetical protein